MIHEYKKKCLFMFFNNDDTTSEEHMSNFLVLFILNPVDDEARYLVMKHFSANIHGTARKWYDDIHDKGIKTMEQFEETFLKIWGTEQDPNTFFQ
jgi:hypothetical protein